MGHDTLKVWGSQLRDGSVKSRYPVFAASTHNHRAQANAKNRKMKSISRKEAQETQEKTAGFLLRFLRIFAARSVLICFRSEACLASLITSGSSSTCPAGR
jgi:hypothetical protein